jgi:hypothetical protein
MVVWPRTKNDCASERLMQITRPDLARHKHYGPTNVEPTQKNQPFLLSKRRSHFKTSQVILEPTKRGDPISKQVKSSWNQRKYDPGS